LYTLEGDRLVFEQLRVFLVELKKKKLMWQENFFSSNVYEGTALSIAVLCICRN